MDEDPVADVTPVAEVSYYERQGQRKVSRRAWCPQHRGEKSSTFVGVNVNGWAFACPVNGHFFIALPPEEDGPWPKTAP